MRVVIDTNVFVSMLLGGQVGKINDVWKTGRFTLIVSEAILSEYQDVLSRPRLHFSEEVIAVVVERRG
jgi:putative PIN family toxin of toxin-antitoxin system